MTLALSHSDMVAPAVIDTLLIARYAGEASLIKVNHISITFKQDLGFSLISIFGPNDDGSAL